MQRPRVIAALLAAAAAARADCLTGTGATGFEAGRQTVIVRPFTGSGEVSASSLPDCEPRSLFVEPGIHPGGLSVVFPMVAALGVAPPIIGAPPLLPSELTPPPIPEPGVYILMSVGLGLVAWAARRRMRPAVPRLEGRSDATWAIAPQ